MDAIDENDPWMICGHPKFYEGIRHPLRRVDRYGARKPVASLWKVVSEIGKEFDFNLHKYLRGRDLTPVLATATMCRLANRNPRNLRHYIPKSISFTGSVDSPLGFPGDFLPGGLVHDAIDS